jgi:hypothetical protein
MYEQAVRGLATPVGGAVAGGTGASLLEQLGSLLTPLDWPRQALWNMVEGLGSGDFLKALPGIGGLALSIPFGPLAGMAAGALGQGALGNLFGDRFEASRVSDLTSKIGGDPESFGQNLLVGALTDPLTALGGLGGFRAGGAAASQLGDADAIARTLGSIRGQKQQLTAAEPFITGAAKADDVGMQARLAEQAALDAERTAAIQQAAQQTVPTMSLAGQTLPVTAVREAFQSADSPLLQQLLQTPGFFRPAVGSTTEDLVQGLAQFGYARQIPGGGHLVNYGGVPWVRRRGNVLQRTGAPVPPDVPPGPFAPLMTPDPIMSQVPNVGPRTVLPAYEPSSLGNVMLASPFGESASRMGELARLLDPQAADAATTLARPVGDFAPVLSEQLGRLGGSEQQVMGMLDELPGFGRWFYNRFLGG